MKYCEKTVRKNKRGEIVSLERDPGSAMYDGKRYILLDEKGNFVQELKVPFKISDYL